MQRNIIVSLKDKPELFDALNQYRISLGWTWKRFMLVGIAETLAKNNDNPDLILAIAQYLGERR